MSLQFNVSTLLREEIGAVRQHAVDSRVLVGDEPSHRAVCGHATLLRTKDGILVSAALAGSEHAECSRCLTELDKPLEIAFQEEFAASVDPVTGAALPPPDDPEAFRINANNVLDMEEAVRQAWMVALPMQPLCRPDCAGLCPACGQNLNDHACSCRPEPDERWGALRELAREMKGT